MLITLLFIVTCSNLITATYFEQSSNVVELNSTNFYWETAHGSWLIFFHLATCGGCIQYTQYFLRFAKDVANWPKGALTNSQFHLGEFDCESEGSRYLCMKFQIKSVPALKYFPGDYMFRRAYPTGIDVPTYEDVASLRRAAVSLLLTERPIIESGPTYNRFELTVSSNSTLENTLIILEFSRKLQQPMISEVDRSLTEMKVKLSMFGNVVASGTPKHVRELLNYAVHYYSGHKTEKTVKTTPVPRSTHVYSVPITIEAADLFLSLSKALYTDVSLVSNIQGENLVALKEFLSTLVLLLPASQSYRQHLANLSYWVGNQTAITGQQWAANLQASNFPIYSGTYQVCRGSKPYYRGYPCGLWLLFHALTVSHCEKEAAGQRLAGDIVAHAMNRFIPRFFSCTICAFHFAENSANIVHPDETILPPRPSPRQFTYNASVIKELPPAPKTCRDEILWLNAVHNRVNLNLAGSPTEDPSAPKIVYPPRWLCSNCWSLKPNSANEWTLGGSEESRTALVDFLTKRFESSAWNYRGVSGIFFTPGG